MLAADWRCGDERRAGGSFLPPVYSRRRLRRRLRDLQAFVEAVSENMDAMDIPRNHRTLEMEYRRLRRQLHHQPQADDVINNSESDSTIMNWVDLRSHSQLLIQRYNASVGVQEKPNPKTRSFVVKGRDLCKSADDVATNMRRKLVHIGRHEGSAPRQSVCLTQPDPSSVSLIKPSSEPTIRVAQPRDRHVISFKKRVAFNTREVHEEPRSSKSNSKGHRVHFAPEDEDSASRDPLGGLGSSGRARREKVRISISNVTNNYLDEGPPRLYYTTQNMALLPVRMTREVSWNR